MSRATIVEVVLLLVAVQAGWIAALLVSRTRRRRTEARSDAIVRALPDLMFVQTRDGVYLDYSAKDESLLFVPPSAFLGRSMRELFPPSLTALFEEKFRLLFESGETVTVDYEIPLPTGDAGHFEARMVRYDADKVLSIVRDVTAEKRATAALLRASKLSMLGEFSASIAHELAQPLSAIAANSRASLILLERDATDVELVRESLMDVIESSRVANDVVRHTRHLFGQDAREKTPIDLEDIVSEVCAMVASTLADHGIALEREADLPRRTVCGDRIQLRQVLLNLISNAVQSMEQLGSERPRRLRIAGGVGPDGSARLQVSDTGIGLPNVDPERLFSESYTTKPNGMGWGLSISRSIVEAHGGRLWAESNEQGGASFTFMLPSTVGSDPDGEPALRSDPGVTQRKNESLANAP